MVIVKNRLTATLSGISADIINRSAELSLKEFICEKEKKKSHDGPHTQTHTSEMHLKKTKKKKDTSGRGERDGAT